jgi:hypothetical protein
MFSDAIEDGLASTNPFAKPFSRRSDREPSVSGLLSEAS